MIDKMIQHCIAAIGLALMAAQGLAQESTVYKSVDDQGNVSFSDTPPDDRSEAETLYIKTAPPVADADAQQRLEDMRQTTDRMVSARLQREQQRAAQQASPVAANNEAEYDANDYYRDIYPVYTDYRNPHHHRPRPPHPRPPIARPPTEQSNVEKLRSNMHNNSQLMRPMLSRGR